MLDKEKKISQLAVNEEAAVQLEVDVGLGYWLVQLNFAGDRAGGAEAFSISPRTSAGLITTQVTSDELHELDMLLETFRSNPEEPAGKTNSSIRKLGMKVSWISDDIKTHEEQFSVDNPGTLSDRQLNFMVNLCARVLGDIKTESARQYFRERRKRKKGKKRRNAS